MAVLVALCVVGAIRFSPSSLSASLGGGDVRTATRSQERQFGGEPIVVSIAGPLGSTLSPNGISGLIDLEGRLAKLDGVAAVVGPGGFINQSTIQADRLVSARLGPSARRAGRAGDRARRSARRRGASAVEAARIADRARVTALGADRAQFERTLARLGGIGLPSIANPAYVNAIVFGSGNAPKARFRWLFPDANHAVILVRPAAERSPGAVLDLNREVEKLVARASLRGATTTVGGSSVAAAASADAVGGELVRVVLLSVLLLGALVGLAVRGRSRRTAATVGGIAIVATVAGVLSSSAVGLGLSVATVAATPVLLALTAGVALRATPPGEPSADEPPTAAGLPAPDGAERPDVGPSLPAATGLVAGVAAAVAVVSWLVGVPVVWHLVGTLVVGGIAGAATVVLAGPRLLGRRPVAGPPAEGVVGGSSSAARRIDGAVGALRRLPGAVRTGLLVAGASALVAGIVLAATLPVRTDPARLGPGGVAERQDARDVAREVGVGGELRIALRGDVTSPASVRWLDRLGARARRIDRRIVVGPNVGELLAGDGRPTARRIAGLLDVTPEYLLKPMLSTDRRTAELRLGIPPVGAAEERAIVRRLVAAADDPPSGLSAEPAGLLAAAERSDRRLEAARLWLPAVCLLLLLGGLALHRRSVPRALGPMVPAVAGLGVVGLLAAGLGIELSPVTIAVVPVGLVLALVLGLRAERSGRDARERGRTGTARVGVDVGLPAALLAAGGLALLASRIVSVREFGLLLAADLLVAAAVAIVLVPGLRPRSEADGDDRDVLGTTDEAADGPGRPAAAAAPPVVAVESDVLR